MTVSSNTPAHKPASERLYGRAKGRPLSPFQTGLMENVYPKIEIDVSAFGAPLNGLSDFDEIWFEIGFGGSEHLIWQAKANTHCAVLGAEPFLNGVCKAVTSVDKDNLDNVRLYHGDARRVLDQLPDASIDTLFILFPDPWPKARHNKRRIISDDFVKEIYRVVKPQGKFRFASDIISYVDWALIRIKNHGGFAFPHRQSSEWRVRGEDWPSTRYLEKAIREGRAGHFFEFIKRDSWP